MNSIEEKLWNYIDGTCSADEHAAIQKLINTNEVYRQKYEEMLAFNTEVSQIELEEPSMGFTYKVMETIRAETARAPLKAAINKNLINGLVGIFIFIMIALIAYVLYNINWVAGNNGAFSNFRLPELKMPVLTASADGLLIKGAVFFITLLALLFTDTYLRRLRTAGQR